MRYDGTQYVLSLLISQVSFPLKVYMKEDHRMLTHSSTFTTASTRCIHVVYLISKGYCSQWAVINDQAFMNNFQKGAKVWTEASYRDPITDQLNTSTFMQPRLIVPFQYAISFIKLEVRVFVKQLLRCSISMENSALHCRRMRSKCVGATNASQI